ncbi:MAG: tetratricopeptide repeat protein [Lentisphaeria bacterium]
MPDTPPQLFAAAAPVPWWRRHQAPLAAAALVLAVLAIYRQTAWFGFVFFDDPGYVFENPLINRGLGWRAFLGVWSSFTGANWHPLTLLSHQLDVTLFGLNAGGHHLTSLVLHAANAVLLFLALRAFTGAFWRAWWVALLFAVHPLHVESVAWIAERKDVLSVFFGLLALLAYRRYVAAPAAGRLALVTALFALSLMAKPMLVTLPCLLLLLDGWPLGRWAGALEPARRWRTVRNLVLEKLPLFLLSAGSCAATLAAQRAGEAVMSLANLPLHVRLANAVVALFEYLRKMVWPADLGAFYPLPPLGHPAGRVMTAAAVAGVLTLLALLLARRRPWWFTGWFWYVGTLVPVLGLVQVGAQAWADRYTYWPLTGVFILVVWEAAALGRRLTTPAARTTALAAAGTATLALGTAAWCQTAFWRHTEPLFRHTLAVAPNNWTAHRALGEALTRDGRLDEALAEYQAAYRAAPAKGMACCDLGHILAVRGDMAASLEWYRRGTAALPDYAWGHYGLGNALAALNRPAEAEAAYRRALELTPEFPDALFNYANLLRDRNRPAEAEARYREALRLKPLYAEAHLNLAALLAATGRTPEAIRSYGELLELEPQNAPALNGLGVLWLRSGRPAEAARALAEAARQQPGNPDTRFNFALALAATGQTGAATDELREVLRLNPGHAAARQLLDELAAARR